MADESTCRPSSRVRRASVRVIRGEVASHLNRPPRTRSACDGVTSLLKILVEMSHQLPGPTRDLLTVFACRLDDGLQGEAHKIGVAIGQHPSFDARWVES